MYGVVLWSDDAENKAVIWCEDHGPLAFYSADDTSVLDGLSMDPGDLVEFDVREESRLRYARNPKVIAQREYPTLPRDLEHASEQAGKKIRYEPVKAAADKSVDPGSENLIRFDFKGAGSCDDALV